MKDITLWITEDALLSSITSIMDALHIANIWNRTLTKKEENLFSVKTVTTDGKPAYVNGGLTVSASGSIAETEKTDCIVLSNTIPTITPFPKDLHILKKEIERLKRDDTIVATVCTGSFLLAEMGFLDGRRATTNWQFAGMFRKKYPFVLFEPEYTLTDDDNFICTGAATAVYNLAIHLIKKFGSSRLASVCSKALLVDSNKQNQTPYTMQVQKKSHGDAEILKAQNFIEKNFSQIESVDQVAEKAGISPRHFKRRFKNATGEIPIKYLQKVRIDAAREMLETTKDTINSITWAVGYKDISSFSRLFKQYTSLSPKTYREKFYNQLPF